LLDLVVMPASFHVIAQGVLECSVTVIFSGGPTFKVPPLWLLLLLLFVVDCNEVEVPAIVCCILAPFSKKPAISNDDTITDNREVTMS
jgi:hypothetical protein